MRGVHHSSPIARNAAALERRDLREGYSQRSRSLYPMLCSESEYTVFTRTAEKGGPPHEDSSVIDSEIGDRVDGNESARHTRTPCLSGAGQTTRKICALLNVFNEPSGEEKQAALAQVCS